MLIGTRLRQLRTQKGMRQGDIEERTGLPSCRVSRIENGRTLPSLETLERFAEVLEVPLYQLFFAGNEAAEGTGKSSFISVDLTLNYDGGPVRILSDAGVQ